MSGASQKKPKSPPRIGVVVDEAFRQRYKRQCKKKGITMSDQLKNLMNSWVEKEELISGIKDALDAESTSQVNIPKSILEMGDSDSSNEPKEVLAAIALISIIADNHVHQDEICSLPQILRSIPLLSTSLTESEAIQLVNDQLERLAKEKREDYINNTIKSITPDIQKDAFKVAAAIIAIDGNVSQTEKEWLERLRKNEIDLEIKSKEKKSEDEVEIFAKLINSPEV